MEKKDMIDRVWQLIEPSAKGYSKMISSLLARLTEAQLSELLADIDEDEED